MKIALAAMPRPVLAEPCVMAQAASGHWHRLDSLCDAAEVADHPANGSLPSALEFLARLGARGRRRIERALDARMNGARDIAFLKPMDPLSKDRKSTRLNSSHPSISYAVFCLKKKNNTVDQAPAASLRRIICKL